MPNMTTQLAAVDFHGNSLTVITGPAGEHLVAMRPISEAIGLDWKSQHARIQRHPVLKSTMVITTTVAEDGKERELACLPLDYLNGWLFGVDASRVRPEIRERLVQYQRECFAALAAYWQQGEAVNPRRRKATPKALPNGLSLDQQATLKALVKARVEALPKQTQAKAAVTCWSALKSRFGCSYKKIEPDQFAEAVGLVARLELEGEWLGRETAPAPGPTFRELVWIDDAGNRQSMPVPPGACVMTVPQMLKALTRPADLGISSRELVELVEVAMAALGQEGEWLGKEKPGDSALNEEDLAMLYAFCANALELIATGEKLKPALALLNSITLMNVPNALRNCRAVIGHLYGRFGAKMEAAARQHNLFMPHLNLAVATDRTQSVHG